MSFGKKTVDGIVSKFRKAVEDLQEVVTVAGQEIETASDEISRLNNKITDAYSESARAQKIINNLNKLLGE